MFAIDIMQYQNLNPIETIIHMRAFHYGQGKFGVCVCVSVNVCKRLRGSVRSSNPAETHKSHYYILDKK